EDFSLSVEDWHSVNSKIREKPVATEAWHTPLERSRRGDKRTEELPRQSRFPIPQLRHWRRKCQRPRNPSGRPGFFGLRRDLRKTSLRRHLRSLRFGLVQTFAPRAS